MCGAVTLDNRKIKIDTIKNCAFIKNYLSRKVVELYFGVRPYVSNNSEDVGRVCLLLYNVTTLLENPIR